MRKLKSNSTLTPKLQTSKSALALQQQQQAHALNEQQQQHYQQFVYTLDQLDCGSIYELYMITRNSVGKSEPSAVVTTRTQGEPPLAPPNKNQLFARIGAQDVLLNLASWSTGGCPLTHINVRYKQLAGPSPAASAATSGAPSPGSAALALQLEGGAPADSLAPNGRLAPSQGWPISTSVPGNLLASINLQQQQPPAAASPTVQRYGHLTSAAGAQPLEAHSLVQQAPFVLKNLQPSTGYELELVAHNSAGHTTAQYGFVTAGANGSRQGYTRREGVLRLDARGQPIEPQVSSSHEQLVPELQDFGQGLGPVAGGPAPGVGQQQLIPLLLLMLCLVCLIISSTFCYYRLAAAWQWKRHQAPRNQHGRRRRASSPSSGGALGELNQQLAAELPGSPCSSMLKSADWQQQHSSKLTMRRHLRDSLLNRRPAGLEEGDEVEHLAGGARGPLGDASELAANQLRLHLQHCQPTAQDSAKLALSQSVSMRGLQAHAHANGNNTLNLKSSACARASSKLGAATIARTGALANNYNNHQLQQQQHSNNSHHLLAGSNNDAHVYAEQANSCRQQQQQHETSWNSAQPQQVVPPPPAQTGTYAVPTSTLQQQQAQFGYQDQAAYAAQDTYGGIDSCIQHLLLSQQQQQQQQQYSMLVGNPKACGYGTGLEALPQSCEVQAYSQTPAANQQQQQQQLVLPQELEPGLQNSAKLACSGYAAVQAAAGRSMIDSSSGSSSGFGGDYSLSTHNQLLQQQQQQGCGGAGSHADCAASGRPECAYAADQFAQQAYGQQAAPGAQSFGEAPGGP